MPLTIEPISIKATAIGRQPQNGGNSFGILPGGPAPTLTTVDRHGVMDAELRDAQELSDRVKEQK